MKTTPRNLALLVGGILLAVPLFGVHPGYRSTYEGYKSCKGCHGGDFSNHASELLTSIHWTWQKTDSFSGNEVGKYNVINNYCVAVPSNEPRCTSCHIGIGWTDSRFNLANEDNIDCLVCHDNSGLYKKLPTGAGAPDPAITADDWKTIYQSIFPINVSRNNCGACHFYGGGGDAVKHGDLDSTMANPDRMLDVHMGTDGGDFSCTQCHSPSSGNPHVIKGTRYSTDTLDNQMCIDCHDGDPMPAAHTSGTQAMHLDKVACQTCHIPAYARGGRATKMTWDWTTAGEKNEDGSIKTLFDENGDPTYDSRKGTFTWASNVIPEYVWFNGNVTYVTLDDQVSADQLVTINKMEGSYDDANARIFPVKRFTGRQPYDAGAGTMAIPNLFPNNAEDTDAYWKGWDWVNALTSGMEYVGRTFTGPVGIVDTEMFWIQNHMVAPKEMALQCADCHSITGQLSFAALGYPADRAEELQTRIATYWGDYEISSNWTVDTGDWLGVLNVYWDPWVYHYKTGNYLYIPQGSPTATGGWTYIPKY